MQSGGELAEALASEIAAVLGPALVGVYLHGSLALGCFNPARSDVDLLVVVAEPLTRARRRALADVLLARSGRPYPIELSVLLADELRRWRHPAPYDFHFAESMRDGRIDDEVAAGGERCDHDLAGHIRLLRERGRVLMGPPVEAVFPAVPAADFLDSILRDLAWIERPETRSGGRIYGVLNACRVLAYVRGAGILSKAEAAEWALGELDASTTGAVARARAAYAAGADEPLGEEEARAAVAEIAALVRGSSLWTVRHSL